MGYVGIFTGEFHILDRVKIVKYSAKTKLYTGTILAINIAQSGFLKNAYGVHIDGDFTPEGKFLLTYCSESDLERLF